MQNFTSITDSNTAATRGSDCLRFAAIMIISLLKPIKEDQKECEAYGYMRNTLVKIRSGFQPMPSTGRVDYQASKFLHSLLISLCRRIKYERKAKVIF